jgi:NAD(P)-dependent dehydrogenase (short-subunit alcohol dehydrogenase family)
MSPTTPRTVLVTGAAKRLGREIALALAARRLAGGRALPRFGRGCYETVAACATSGGCSRF